MVFTYESYGFGQNRFISWQHETCIPTIISVYFYDYKLQYILYKKLIGK